MSLAAASRPSGAVRALLRRKAATNPSSAPALRVRNASSTSHGSDYDPDYVEWNLEKYPKMPDVSRQHSPPKGWQDVQQRRNFGETLHPQEELYSMWGPDVPPVEPSTALRHFTVAALGFISFGALVKYVIAQDPPVVRREYPYDGLNTALGGIEENKARTESGDSEE